MRRAEAFKGARDTRGRIADSGRQGITFISQIKLGETVQTDRGHQQKTGYDRQSELGEEAGAPNGTLIGRSQGTAWVNAPGGRRRYKNRYRRQSDEAAVPGRKRAPTRQQVSVGFRQTGAGRAERKRYTAPSRVSPPAKTDSRPPQPPTMHRGGDVDPFVRGSREVGADLEVGRS